MNFVVVFHENGFGEIIVGEWPVSQQMKDEENIFPHTPGHFQEPPWTKILS